MMARYLCRVALGTSLSVVVLLIVIAVIVWVIDSNKTSNINEYIGPKVTLTAPSASVRSQIYSTVISSLYPHTTTSVQGTIHIYAYVTNAAKGTVTFRNTYPAIQFMVTKSDNKWIVIDHTTNKTLTLPSSTIAQKYHLPSGWYANN